MKLSEQFAVVGQCLRLVPKTIAVYRLWATQAVDAALNGLAARGGFEYVPTETEPARRE